MSHSYRTKEFKELRRSWYKKLERSGFEDIEDLESPLELLKTWHSAYFQKRHSPQSFESTQEYYYLATNFFEEHAALSDFEKRVWAYHAEGHTMREIAQTMNAEGFKTNKDVVNRIVLNLSELMKKGFR